MRDVLLSFCEVGCDEGVVPKEKSDANEGEGRVDLLSAADGLLERELLCLDRAFLRMIRV